MPLKIKSVLAAKIETTAGTAETVLAADAAENFYNVEMKQTTAMSDRVAQGSYDSLASIQELRTGSLKFRTDFRGDGAGGVPFWASVLLPGCGYKNTAGTFSPVTEAPGSNVKTLTFSHYQDGRVKKMRGCVGTAKFMFPTGKLAYVEWDWIGAWVSMIDATILAPTYPTTRPLRVANATFTVGSWSPCFEMLDIELGNNTEIRPCATVADGSGVHSAVISNRRAKGSYNPEAALVATADPYGDWATPTERAFSFDLEDATDKITLAGPKFQILDITDGERAGLVTDAINFAFNKSSASGNDSLTIAFSVP